MAAQVLAPSQQEDKHCSAVGCAKSIKDHYWGHVKAEGWFFSKAGEAYCPEHLPEWVPAWRERVARAREQRSASGTGSPR